MELKLPLSVITKLDLLRLVREANALQEYLLQAQVRSGGTPMPQLPKLSRLLDDTARANEVNLLDADQRARLIAALEQLKASALVIHMSFAAEPSGAFLTNIITWLRGNISSLVVLQVGLQPQLAAGCIVRTENKLLDFSLRAHFISRREALAKILEGKPQ